MEVLNYVIIDQKYKRFVNKRFFDNLNEVDGCIYYGVLCLKKYINKQFYYRCQMQMYVGGYRWMFYI